MTYVLREQVNNQYYCKDHNKIIEFDTIDEARKFINAFAQYAITQAMTQMMNNPGLIMDVQQVLQSTIIDEKPNSSHEYININDILREKGVY